MAEDIFAELSKLRNHGRTQSLPLLAGLGGMPDFGELTNIQRLPSGHWMPIEPQVDNPNDAIPVLDTKQIEELFVE